MSETNHTNNTERLKMEQNIRLGHNKFQKEIEELKLELQRVKQIGDEKDMTISDLEKLKTNLEKQLSELKSSSSKSVSSSDEESKKLLGKLSEYEKLLDQEKQKTSEISNKLTKSNQEVSELKQVAEKYKKLLVDHDSLEKRVNSISLSETNKNKEIESNKGVIGNLKSEKDTLVILVEKLEKEIEELKRVKTDDENELKAENSRKDQIIEDLVSKLESTNVEQKRQVMASRKESKSVNYIRGKRRMAVNKTN